jgi:hypothetical protein
MQTSTFKTENRSKERAVAIRTVKVYDVLRSKSTDPVITTVPFTLSMINKPRASGGYAAT